MRFSSFLSGEFTTMTVINSQERKLAKCTSVHCTEIDFALSFGAVIVKMTDLSKTESRDFFTLVKNDPNS